LAQVGRSRVQVSTSAEEVGLAARQHNGFHGRVDVGGGKERDQLVRHAQIEAVAARRSVQREHADAVGVDAHQQRRQQRTKVGDRVNLLHRKS
jgi:hypothetical protein